MQMVQEPGVGAVGDAEKPVDCTLPSLARLNLQAEEE